MSYLFVLLLFLLLLSLDTRALQYVIVDEGRVVRREPRSRMRRVLFRCDGSHYRVGMGTEVSVPAGTVKQEPVSKSTFNCTL